MFPSWRSDPTPQRSLKKPGRMRRADKPELLSNLLRARARRFHFRRSVEFLEIFAEQIRELGRGLVVGILVGPGVARIKQVGRHIRGCLGDAEPEGGLNREL